MKAVSSSHIPMVGARLNLSGHLYFTEFFWYKSSGFIREHI